MYIIPEKSSSCQLVADFKAKKRRNTSKTTQKCQNCLKIQGKKRQKKNLLRNSGCRHQRLRIERYDIH